MGNLDPRFDRRFFEELDGAWVPKVYWLKNFQGPATLGTSYVAVGPMGFRMLWRVGVKAVAVVPLWKYLRSVPVELPDGRIAWEPFPSLMPLKQDAVLTPMIIRVLVDGGRLSWHFRVAPDAVYALQLGRYHALYDQAAEQHKLFDQMERAHA